MKVLIRHLLKKTRSGGYAQRDEDIESPTSTTVGDIEIDTIKSSTKEFFRSNPVILNV